MNKAQFLRSLHRSANYLSQLSELAYLRSPPELSSSCPNLSDCRRLATIFNIPTGLRSTIVSSATVIMLNSKRFHAHLMSPSITFNHHHLNIKHNKSTHGYKYRYNKDIQTWSFLWYLYFVVRCNLGGAEVRIIIALIIKTVHLKILKTGGKWMSQLLWAHTDICYIINSPKPKPTYIYMDTTFTLLFLI